MSRAHDVAHKSSAFITQARNSAHPAVYVCSPQNLLEHEDEIYARPARTWFQTEKEKKAAAAAAAAAAAQGMTVMEMDAAAGEQEFV